MNLPEERRAMMAGGGIRTELPPDESSRIAALYQYEILDTPAEQAYDDLARLAAYTARTPIALVSLIDRDRQWFKSKVGLDAAEMPRQSAFCAHAILQPDAPMVVADATRDERFADNPLVTGEPGIRFYCGVPLVTPERHALGTLCVIDRVPREMTPDQIDALSALSRQVVAQFELRRQAAELQRAAADREVYLTQLERYHRQMVEANAALEEQNLIDRLTGLANRKAFDRALEEEVYRSIRYATQPSLLMVDVDRFGEYNGSFGQPAGDTVLKAIARIMRRCARPCDIVSRFGGGKFAVILPSTDREGAYCGAERLREAVEAAAFPHRPVTISAGVSTLPDQWTDGRQLLAAAELALSAAKRSGRNRIAQADTAPT